MQFGRYGRNPGWAVLAVLAIVYGAGGAILSGVGSEQGEDAWWRWGSLLLGVCFLAFMVVPFVLWAARGERARDGDKPLV